VSAQAAISSEARLPAPAAAPARTGGASPPGADRPPGAERAAGADRSADVAGADQNAEAIVVVTTGVIAGLNYLYTVIMVWLLQPTQYAVVGSISALLLIWGTVASASVPWVLAREVVLSEHDPLRRRRAVCFAVTGTLAQSVAAGAATCLIAAHYAAPPALVAAFGSVVTIFAASTAAGYLQGRQRFRLLAVLRTAEVVVKIGTGVALVLLGEGAGGAVSGFAFGAAVVVAVGAARMAPDIRWARSAVLDRALWSATASLFSIQAGVAVLATLDVVLGSLVLGASRHLATYQAANILGRVPLFVGTAVSMVVFPRLVGVLADRNGETRDSLRLYLRICVPLTAVTVTAPHAFVEHLFPASYGDVSAVLPWAAVAGFLLGLVNLTTTYFQAAGLVRRTTMTLVIGIVFGVALDYVGLRAGGDRGLAQAVAVVAALVSVSLLRDTGRRWPGSLRSLGRTLLGASALSVPLFVAKSDLAAWVVVAALFAGLPAFDALVQAQRRAGGAATGRRPRVLHLGYEDPRRPGAGGGSVRTHEINRRLADQLDITVVCARFPGCGSRVDDGVRYVHMGIPGSYNLSIISYFLFIPIALLRYPSDLVVEDFGAPFSSIAVPWMTRRPVVGVVQWLFAGNKREEYGLPFDLVERLGVRSHRRLIAVSAELGSQLRSRNPRARVAVVENGLDPAAFVPRAATRAGIAYLGRLEIAQKGLDLLLDAYASAGAALGEDLFIGGDGPDREELEARAERLGISSRVHFVGRVEAGQRFDWLASARMVAMPSRYETFGMVAAEALAVGTPVVAFDIACLRGLVTPETGVVVQPFDVAAFAAALVALSSDQALARRLGARGPAGVAGLDWDILSREQGSFYRSVLADDLARCQDELEPTRPTPEVFR
jgi:glycosyltransferase involved in cell wall biosynthesis/O-antigen/teichoic acid export membrane protein